MLNMITNYLNMIDGQIIYSLIHFRNLLFYPKFVNSLIQTFIKEIDQKYFYILVIWVNHIYHINLKQLIINFHNLHIYVVIIDFILSILCL